MHEITWEMPVAVDLFFAGLGAGSFCLGAVTAGKKGAGWEACSRMSSTLAPIAIVIGLSMLILDLRNKPRFWMTMTVLNIHSPMSIGVWLLSAFFLASFLFALYGLPSVRQRIPWFGELRIWNRPDWRNRLGRTGVLLALGVMVYTGVLLSASSIPLWRNLNLPLLFVLSALSTGFAGGALSAMLSLDKENREAMQEPLRFLRRSFRILLSFYFILILSFSLSLLLSSASRSAATFLMTGWNGFLWWAGVVVIGIIVPLIFVLNSKELKMRQACFLFSCVLIGGFLMRTVLILAGQRS
jgi:formate-dependent nitrite reductase membrane component NrfD